MMRARAILVLAITGCAQAPAVEPSGTDGTVEPGGTDGSPDAVAADAVPKPACDDGIKNGNETDVDCGGDCRACTPPCLCKSDADCPNTRCVSCACQAPACGDGLKNGGETDVDCGGGGMCAPCGVGKRCAAASDCASTVCRAMRCVPPPAQLSFLAATEI